MEKKWIILIVLVIVFNLIGAFFLKDTEWSLPFTIIANVIIFGWAGWAALSNGGKK